jgi:hypothetical protein
MTAAIEEFSEQPALVSLDINRIRIDGGTQPRVQLDGNKVKEYSEAILHQGARFPPIDVFFDGVDYWLADGFHRLFAHQMLAGNESVVNLLAQLDQDIRRIAARVHRGSQREAILFSVGANALHGLPRKNEDKRQAVDTLVRDVQEGCAVGHHICRGRPREGQCWNAWSNGEIARQCVVSRSLVHSVRADFEEEIGHTRFKNEYETRTFVHPKTGQPSEMNIGTPAPSPEQVAERAADVAAMPAGYQADIEDYAPAAQPDGVHPATERAIDIAIKAQIFALSLRITPTTFDDALPPLMRDKVAATLDAISPWLKALEASREAD